DLVIEAPGPYGLVEPANRAFEFFRGETKSDGQFHDARCRYRRKHRRHEPAHRFRVDDRVGDLIRLLCDESSPDRVALRPKILALIVKTIAVFVHDDSERHAIKACDDAAVEFRGPAVDGDSVTLTRVSDGFDTMGEKQL